MGQGLTRAGLSAACLIGCIGCSDAAPAGSTFAFEHVNVVDVRSGNLLPDRTVLVRGTRITEVRPSADGPVSSDIPVVDASGRFMIPGLWDMHMHLIDPDTPGSPEVVLPLLVANGVAGVRDLATSSVDSILDLREEVRTGGRLGPRIVLAGNLLDGVPMVFPPDAIAVSTPEEGRRVVDSLASRGVDLIKAYEMLLPEVFLAIVEEAGRHGLGVAAHPPLSMDASDAVIPGVTSFEHLRNIELACSSRADSLLTARRATLRTASTEADTAAKAFEWSEGYGSGALVRRGIHASQRPRALETLDENRCAALIRKLADNGTWQTPTLFLSQRAARQSDTTRSVRETLRYVPEEDRAGWEHEAQRAASAPEAERAGSAAQSEWFGSLVGTMRDGGVGLLAGTDVSVVWMVPGFSLHEELHALVGAGLTPLEALQTATLNPALYLGATDSLGTIEPGRVADLVLVDGNPLADIQNTRRIHGVMLNGRYLDRTELDRLLASAERAAM